VPRSPAGLALVLVPACGRDETVPTPPPPPTAASPPPAASPAPASDVADPEPDVRGQEPGYVTVDHILIGVIGPRSRNRTRTVEEGRALAEDLLRRLEADPRQWDDLKRRYSEDPPPGGPYDLANRGVQTRHGREFPREGMVQAFGDVGFRLRVGEVGLAEYHPEASYFGFHLIKRVR
jgi:hypothetical protein